MALSARLRWSENTVAGFAVRARRRPARLSGWYRFVHRFFDDNGNLGIEMSIINDATRVRVADWTIIGSGPQSGYSAPEPISEAGGPVYGYFATAEIPSLPIDNAVLIVTPVTKDQCKQGGWSKYTDANGTPFKNQGDCVSYVATGGNNLANG